jgi:Bacteriophage protein of unknown function (DUF646).
MGEVTGIVGIAECVSNCTVIVSKIALASHDAVKDSAEILKNKMVELAPRWTGNLQDVAIQSVEVELNTFVVGPDMAIAPYAPFMEYGHPDPYLPNMDNITPWAEDHGMSGEQAVATIAKHGFKAHPFIHPAMELSKPEIEEKLAGMSAIISL